MKQKIILILCFLLISLCSSSTGIENNDNKEELSSLKEELSSLKEELSSLKEEASSLKEEASSLKEEVSSLSTPDNNNEKTKEDFLTWGSEYFYSVLDIWGIDSDENFYGLGTGAIITKDGFVITNYHVAIGYEEFSVYSYSEYDSAKEIWIDPQTNKEVQGIYADWVAGSQCYDLALLKMDTIDEKPYLEWYGDFIPGLEIYTLGYPSVGQGELTVSNGIVSSLRNFGSQSWTAPGFDTFGHTAPIFFGNSGSPVLSDEGKIVGINYTSYQQQDEQFSISYAINNQVAKKIVDDYLIKGDNYLNLGFDGYVDNLYYLLENGDDRKIPYFFIETVHPNSISDIALVENNEILLLIDNEMVDLNDLSNLSPRDGYPTLEELCNQIRKWENSNERDLELVLYSCSIEGFYVATLNKDGEEIEPYGIENPFDEFTKDDFNLVCNNN